MSNGQRTLNDLNSMRLMGTPVNAPMPAPVMPYMPTPHDISGQFFGSMNVAAHARFGYQQIGQFNQNSPVGLGGQYAPNANMMMPSNLSVFRPPPTPMPPPLRTTPGETAAFHTPMDIGTQQAMMMAGTYLDPSAGARALARRNAGEVGGYVGAGVGAIAGGMMTGGMGALKGASWGSALGDMFGGAMASIPIVGDLMAWGEREEAQMLSNMAGVQMGTMGRVSMGRQDIGLGGRGMNAQSSMRLGQNLQRFSNQMAGVKPTAVSGGAFNEADIRNLVAASADSGLLDAASNMDQIEGTVKKVMTLVGRLGKLTGDPDFRNNIRELGKMKMLGFEMDQAVDAMASMGRYGVASGMSRTQLMNQAVEPAMARFAAAGLTPGLGMTHGAFGAAEGRMQAGIGTAIQQSLMGDVGQRATEANAAFLSGHAKMLLPALYKAEGGQLTLDPAKIQEIASAGAINLRTMAGQGAQNMKQVAEDYARQKIAKGEGSERDFQALFREGYAMMGSRQSEFLSELGTKMSPEQTMRANLAMAAGLQKQGLSQWESVMAVTADAQGRPDPMQAKMMLDYAKDPKRHERYMAQLDQQIAKAEGDASKLGRAKAAKWADEHRAGGAYKAVRGFGRWASDLFTDEFDPDDQMEAAEEARNIEMQKEMATSGTKSFRQAVTGGGELSSRLLDIQMKKQKGRAGQAAGDLMFDDDMTTIDETTGEVSLVMGGGKLSEDEQIRMQRLSGDYGTLGGWGARNRHYLGAMDVFNPLPGNMWRGGAKGRYDFQSTRQEYNKLMKEAERSVGVVNKAQARGRKEQLRLEGQVKTQFKKWGLDGDATMASVKTKLLAEVKARGVEGMGTTSKDMEGILEKALTGYKDKNGKTIPPGQVKAFMKANPTLLTEVFTKTVLEGGEEGAGSVLEAKSVGESFKKYATQAQQDNLEELQETMHDDLLDWLEEGGVAEVDWDSGLDAFEETGMREAFQTMHDSMGYGGDAQAGAEEAYITALYAQAQEGGEGSEAAQAELERLRGLEAGGDKKVAGQLKRAKGAYGKMDKTGKKSLGDYMGMFKKKMLEADPNADVSRKGIMQALKLGQKGEGPLGKMVMSEQFAGIAGQVKGAGKTELDALGSGFGAPSKEVDKLKKEKTAAEDLHKVWTAPGGIADKFDTGMDSMNKATQNLRVVATELAKRLP